MLTIIWDCAHLDFWTNFLDCFVRSLKLFDVILISPIYISHRSILVGFMVMTKVIICFEAFDPIYISTIYEV